MYKNELLSPREVFVYLKILLKCACAVFMHFLFFSRHTKFLFLYVMGVGSCCLLLLSCYVILVLVKRQGKKEGAIIIYCVLSPS